MTVDHLLGPPISTTPVIVRPVTGQPPADPDARISFRQPVSTAGYVDAAWWPRSLDLSAELPALLDLLWAAGRNITRVTYNIAAWDPAPRRLSVAARVVRLGGFTIGDPLIVSLTDAWDQERIDILVIAPDTEARIADRALLLASAAEGTNRAAEILDLARNDHDAETGARR